MLGVLGDGACAALLPEIAHSIKQSLELEKRSGRLAGVDTALAAVCMCSHFCSHAVLRHARGTSRTDILLKEMGAGECHVCSAMQQESRKQ